LVQTVSSQSVSFNARAKTFAGTDNISSWVYIFLGANMAKQQLGGKKLLKGDK